MLMTFNYGLRSLLHWLPHTFSALCCMLLALGHASCLGLQGKPTLSGFKEVQAPVIPPSMPLPDVLVIMKALKHTEARAQEGTWRGRVTEAPRKHQGKGAHSHKARNAGTK